MGFVKKGGAVISKYTLKSTERRERGVGPATEKTATPPHDLHGPETRGGDSQISIPYLPGGHLILDIFPLASTSKL